MLESEKAQQLSTMLEVPVSYSFLNHFLFIKKILGSS